MIRRAMGSRPLLILVVLLLIATGAASAYTVLRPAQDMRTYCALMPDSIGLFSGSHVTIRGVPVGTVSGIEVEGDRARVTFTVRSTSVLPSDSAATTVSDSLIADRRLAIIGDPPTNGPGRDPHECITNSTTPKSMSRTFTTIADLASELDAGRGSVGEGSLRAGLAALDESTRGRGDQVNSIIRQLGTAMNSPDAAIGHIAGLIDSLAELSMSARDNWPEIRSMLTRLTEALAGINNLGVPPIVSTMASARDVFPFVTDVTRTIGTPALVALDGAQPLVQMSLARLGSVNELVAMIPAVAGAFTPRAASDSSGLAFRSPQIALPRELAAHVCPIVAAVTATGCAPHSDGAVAIALSDLIVGAAGAR